MSPGKEAALAIVGIPVGVMLLLFLLNGLLGWSLPLIVLGGFIVFNVIAGVTGNKPRP